MNEPAHAEQLEKAEALLSECLWALNSAPNFPYVTSVHPWETWTPEFKGHRGTSYDLASKLGKYFRGEL